MSANAAEGLPKRGRTPVSRWRGLGLVNASSPQVSLRNLDAVVVTNLGAGNASSRFCTRTGAVEDALAVRGGLSATVALGALRARPVPSPSAVNLAPGRGGRHPTGCARSTRPKGQATSLLLRASAQRFSPPNATAVAALVSQVGRLIVTGRCGEASRQRRGSRPTLSLFMRVLVPAIVSLTGPVSRFKGVVTNGLVALRQPPGACALRRADVSPRACRLAKVIGSPLGSVRVGENGARLDLPAHYGQAITPTAQAGRPFVPTGGAGVVVQAVAALSSARVVVTGAAQAWVRCHLVAVPEGSGRQDTGPRLIAEANCSAAGQGLVTGLTCYSSRNSAVATPPLSPEAAPSTLGSEVIVHGRRSCRVLARLVGCVASRVALRSSASSGSTTTESLGPRGLRLLGLSGSTSVTSPMQAPGAVISHTASLLRCLA